MKTIPLKLDKNGYKIIIGHQMLPQLPIALNKLDIGRDAVIITNPVVNKLHGKNLAACLKKNGFSTKTFEVPDSEESKCSAVALDLIGKVAQYDVKRKVFIIALGGGVIGDLAGFVAAVYKRGIPYIQVPTTFLAQVDSAIGGKVAIDLPIGKNLIGAFYQPKMVWSDIDVLLTLSKRQVRNGLSESVKYGIIKDKALFEFIEHNYLKLLSLDKKCLEHVIHCCSQIKADVVMKDERETKGIRTILNFGHTIGHAVESVTKYQSYGHGEAVALGMNVAAEISVRLGLFSKNNAYRLRQVLKNIGLPVTIKQAPLNDIIKVMSHDKKFLSGKNRFVLAKQLGRVTVQEGIPLDVIKASIKSCM